MTTPLFYSLTRRGVDLSLVRSAAARFRNPSLDPWSPTFRETLTIEEIESESRARGHLRGNCKPCSFRWGKDAESLKWKERHRKAMQARKGRERRAKAPPKGVPKPKAQPAILACLAKGPQFPSVIAEEIMRGIDSTRNHLHDLERRGLVKVAMSGIKGPGGREALWKLK